jgi:hypothetical protein
MKRKTPCSAPLAGLILACAAACMTSAACSDKRSGAILPAPEPGAAPVSASPSVPAADPRLAFESTGLLKESGQLGPFSLCVESRGLLEAGPVVLSEGASSGLAFALSRASLSKAEAEDLLVLYRGESAEPLTVSLPGPVVGLASSGGRLLALLADGSALCYDAELKVLWRRGGASDLALALPGGKFALSGPGADSGGGKLTALDSSEGKELWSQVLPAQARAIAYSVGSVLAADGNSIAAFAEADGHEVMRQSLGSPARALASGSGLVAALEESGDIEIRDLASGALVSRAAGKFDKGIAPLLDNGRLFAALAGGSPSGAASEIDAKSGGTSASFEWAGPLSSLSADSDYLYGLRGSRLFASPRQGSGKAEIQALPEAASSGLASFEGGLYFVGRSGGLFACRPEAKGNLAKGIGALLSPDAQTAEAIASSLDKFKAREGTTGFSYLDFDLFVEGIPVDPGRSYFCAYRFEPEASKRYRISSQSSADQGRVLLAVFSASGALLDSNFDDYGLAPSFDASLEKGGSYWIVTGRLDSLTEGYRLSVR